MKRYFLKYIIINSIFKKTIYYRIMAKPQTYKDDIYPEDFNDLANLDFDSLSIQALDFYPNIEIWIMIIAVIAHIIKINGNGIPLY
jgi:hypothetical protein